MLMDGSPAGPAGLPSKAPTWRPGDEVFLNPTSRLRVTPSATRSLLLSASSDSTDRHQGTLEGSRARLQAA